jgi:hypothetical protein
MESVADTTMNNNHYYIIQTMKAPHMPCFSLEYYPGNEFMYLRNDTLNKKVYAWINNTDSLIYNFDLQVGDTAMITSASPGPYIVDSIVAKPILGIVRNVFYAHNVGFAGKLLEGLGSEFGFINYTYDSGFEGGYTNLCIKYNGITLWGDTSSLCNFKK